MKRHASQIGAAALLVALAGTTATAQSPASHYINRPIEINGHIGALIFDDVIAGGDTELMGGFRVVYNLPSGLGIGGNFDAVAVEDASMLLYSGEVDYTFGSPNQAHFFVGLGIGQARIEFDGEDDSRTDPLIPVAVGLKWFNRTHDPNWALRGELRDNIILLGDPFDETTHNIELSGGVSLLLGS